MTARWPRRCRLCSRPDCQEPVLPAFRSATAHAPARRSSAPWRYRTRPGRSPQCGRRSARPTCWRRQSGLWLRKGSYHALTISARFSANVQDSRKFARAMDAGHLRWLQHYFFFAAFFAFFATFTTLVRFGGGRTPACATCLSPDFGGALRLTGALLFFNFALLQIVGTTPYKGTVC